jgi:hypothetical protein
MRRAQYLLLWFGLLAIISSRRKEGNRARINTDDLGAGMGEGAGST